MHISNISITNYRGVKETRQIKIEPFSSIVGKNDAGKTIILFAIASFLDVKTYAISYSDFNDIEKPIEFEFDFKDENIKELLISKLKSKVKKTDGLEEYVDDYIFDGALKFKRIASKPDKKFSEEYVLVEEYLQEDIRGLYLKSDEELNSIVEGYKIEIPVQGKGRNSKAEKIKYIKEYFTEAERVRFWMEDDSKISSLFPEVEMFKADYGLEADTKFKTNSVSEIQDYFDKQTGNKESELNKVASEIVEEMRKEAESVKNYMKDYASNLKAVEITPAFDWKAAVKSVDVGFQFEGDKSFIPMSHKGTGYRRLFMVARFRYLAEKSKGKNIIYLIEEPETFLHPTAQSDLLTAFKELSNENQIIITTHSPVFAGATNVNGVILCTREEQSNYFNAEQDGDTAFLHKVISELGIKPSYNLRDDFDKILFVEGQDDATFYKIVCQKVLGKNLDDKILTLPTGGSSIDSFINITYFKKNGRELILIIDSDKGLSVKNPEKPIIQQRTASHFQENFGKSYLLKKSNIESYFHPRAIERRYNHLEAGSIHYFSDDEDLKELFKEKGINKKHNIDIFNSMSKEEFEEVLERELIDFLKNILE